MFDVLAHYTHVHLVMYISCATTLFSIFSYNGFGSKIGLNDGFGSNIGKPWNMFNAFPFLTK